MIAARRSTLLGIVVIGVVLPWATGCSDTNEPTTGAVAVFITTTGGDLDLDGYGVTVDAVQRQTVGVNAAVVIRDLPTGSHEVALSGVAGNCTVNGGNARSATVTGGDTTNVGFTVACVATGVRITTATTGIDVDSNGYALAMDGVPVGGLGPNGSVVITRVAAGSHTVTLGAVAGNCAVGGENPRSVTVAVGEIVPLAFAVTCGAVTGVVAVTAATSGLDLDPNGYQILVDNSASQAINSNGTIYFSGVAGGSHQVELQVAFVYPNCTVSGVNPRTLSVTTGGATRDTARTTFQVTCAALGSLSITAPTSGVDPDPNGYRADAVGMVSAFVDVPATGGTATISRLPAGDYSVTLTGATANCDVVGPNPRTVSVPSGGTAAVAFDVTCAQAAQLAVSLTVNGNTDVYTVKSNGAGLTRLTTDPAYDHGPAWSPDGTKIAFWSNRDGNDEIYVMNQDGLGVTRLTNDTSADFRPRWSPDGTKIVFVNRRNGNLEIYVMNADGSSPLRLTNDPATDADPAWSPDGSKIAFWSSRAPDGEIYVMNANGSGVTPITNNDVLDIQPEWSPDGSKLVFSRLTGCDSYTSFCDYDLFVMNADGSGEAQLTSASSDNDAAWSPDGGSIAFGASFCAPYYYYYYYYSYGCYYSYSAVYIVRTDGTRVVELLRDASYPAWRR